MKSYRKILPTVLCFVLLISAVFSSCQTEEGNWLRGQYEYVDELVPYIKADLHLWRSDIEAISMYTPGRAESYMRWIPADDPDYKLYDFSQPVIEEIKIPYSYTRVSSGVYEYLQSGDQSARELLIRAGSWKCAEGYETWEQRDAIIGQWCEEKGLDGEVIPMVGYLSSHIAAAHLLTIAQEDDRVLVCFRSEFESIHGVTIEEAQDMIERELFDIWSCPMEGSFLYGKSGSDIKSSLAE